MSATGLSRTLVHAARARRSLRGHATHVATDLQDRPTRQVIDIEAPPEEPVDPAPAPPRPESPTVPPRPEPADVVIDFDPDHAAPVVPVWLGHPVCAGRRMARHWAHVAMFHALRVPEYLAHAVQWSPVGLYRCVVGLYRWVTDAEGKDLRWNAAARDDPEAYVVLCRQRNDRVHHRLPVAVALVVLVAAVAAVGVVVSPWSPLTRVVTVVAAVVALGLVGAPADRPWLEHAVVAPAARKITPDLLIQAFAAARLCSIDPGGKPGPIRFLSPIAHDGPGVRATIELPPGVTATKAIARREEIAAGLDIDEFRVFIDRVRGTEGSARRIVAWIADRDPYEADPVVSPLATAKTWDFWKPFPFGTDARGRPVDVELVWSSLLVGAIPRMGKTYAARLALAAAALDPTTRIVVFDGKGGKDWAAFELVAHYYGSGVRQPVVEALLSVLQDAVEDMNDRFERMRSLPDDVCPDGKVTPQITRRASYRMPLTVIAVDEVHRYLEHPEHGATVLALLTELAKVGPASGYMLVLATQRPDAKVIPAGLRDQVGTRFALKVMTWQSSEVILGAGTYGAGLDASSFLKSHKGVGILLGADDNASEEPATVRTHLLETAALRKVCERGRQLRIDRGSLSGMAAGEVVLPDAPQRRLLDDLLDVFPPGDDRVWSGVLCGHLAEQWPDRYDGWDATLLANALAKFGIETGLFWGHTDEGKGTSRMGVYREQLLDAIAERAPDVPSDDQVA